MPHPKDDSFYTSSTKSTTARLFAINKRAASRRKFIKKMAFAAAIAGAWPLLSLQSARADDWPREFVWQVPEVHLKTVQDNLKFDGNITPHKDAKGLVVIFAGAALLVYLAEAVLALRRQMVYGGVVIDTRGDKIDIKTDKSLPGKTIVVVTSSGSHFHEPQEAITPSILTDILMKVK